MNQQETRQEENILPKKEAETNPSYGCIPEQRPIRQLIEYGIVNLNKPSGPTSHQVADTVKKIVEVSRAGHSGSLDPHVSGVLPIALEKATRITEFLLLSEKEYVAWMHLHKEVEEERLKRTLNEFIGVITQLPPRKSAVKRQERQRKVSRIDILEIRKKEVLFSVSCQAGTYIRKLIHDMGQRLGVGAHMAQLIRTKAGPFTNKSWHALQDLKDAYEFCKEEIRKVILPYERAVDNLKKVWVLDSTVSSLCHGSSLGVPGIAKIEKNILPHDKIALMTLKGELVSIGVAQLSSQEMLLNAKGLAAIPYKVFMEPNTYKSS